MSKIPPALTTLRDLPLAEQSPAYLLSRLCEQNLPPGAERCLLIEGDFDQIAQNGANSTNGAANHQLHILAIWDRERGAETPQDSAFDLDQLPILGQIVNGKVLNLADLSDPALTEVDQITLTAFGIVGGLIVPLRHGAQVTGTLLIADRNISLQAPFDPAHYELLATLLVSNLDTLRMAERLAFLESVHTGLIETDYTAYIVVDLDGVILEWGSGATALYGYPSTEMIGRSLAALTMGATPETTAVQLRSLAGLGRTARRDMQRVARHGRPINVRLMQYPIYDVEGNIAAIGDMSAPQPSDKAAEETALHAVQERDRLEAILDSTNDAIVMIDTESRVVTANQQFERFFDSSRYSLLGQQADDMLALLPLTRGFPQRVSNLFLSLATDMQQTVGGDFDMEIGEPRTLVWFSAPVFSHDGSVLGRMFVFRDMTNEREAERMKTEFVALVSHELRTPLTPILGFTDLLLEGEAGPLDEHVRRYISYIKVNADRLLRLANDTLDMTRVEAGRVDLRPERIRVAKLLSSIVTPLSHAIGQKGIKLDLNVPDKTLDIWADPGRVTQVISKLLSNAVRHTPENGAIQIVVRNLREIFDVPAGAPSDIRLPAVLIAVHDTGIGIDSEDQPQMFTRFFRTAQSIEQQIANSGLGLYLVKSLVELQGGRVWVESELGQGASFYFTIPVAD